MVTSRKSYYEKLNVDYIGSVASSAKLEKSQKKGYDTYGIYLSPADSAGNGKSVCPNCKHCKKFCLNGSGRAIMDARSGKNTIFNARKKKTDAYWNDRVNLTDCIGLEIESAEKSSAKKNRPFSVRLNCTSDLCPETFIDSIGRNLLERFSHIQFYDYTKVPKYLEVAKKYNNYDLTFSYDGHNWNTCNKYLNDNGRVAVVFRDKLPLKYRGFDVIDGNGYDMRYLDPKGVIVGLTYHVVIANGNKNDGTWVEPNTDFVVSSDDKFCVWR